MRMKEEIMFQNYLKTAFRNLLKDKLYFLINTFGLAVGMACCLLIVLFIHNELSFDRFHEKADQIYRVIAKFSWGERPDHFAHTPAPLAPAIIREFPAVINAVRFTGSWQKLIAYEDKQFWVDKFIYVDPHIFNVFTFPLIKGDPQTALKDLYSMVITEETAQKFFGNEDPIGKILKVGDIHPRDYKVTGVLKNILSNSQLQFDCLASFEHFRSNIEWGHWNYTTYILLPPKYPYQQLEEKLPVFLRKNLGPDQFKDTSLHLQPLTSIHLHSQLRNDLATNRNITQIYFFSAIAILILVIACINFMNLSTARSANREKEVGVRKVIGANRLQLIKQFLGESLLISFIALLVALTLVEFFLPTFNNLVNNELSFDFFQNFSLLASLFGITLITGIIAGSYPAFFISASQPKDVFTGGSSFIKTSKLRKFLVVGQFAISIIFISCTIIIHNQLTYIKNKNLGYSKNHLVIIPTFYQNVKPKYEIYKNEILKNANIQAATATYFKPSNPNYHQNVWWEGMQEDEWDYISWIPVDHDFLKTFQIDLVRGRDFSREFISDANRAYILNESAVKWIGWNKPIGKQFKINDSGKVIGIIKDFHFQSLHNKIEPLALCLYPDAFFYLYVRINPKDISHSIDFLKQKWTQLFPEFPFQYSFFDEDFNRIYKSEMRLGKIFSYVTGLAIFIACLGLFGLASFMAEKRTKEIGIRKVLGATVSGIVIMLSKEFTRWIILANLIALPVVWFGMNKWLQDFAYRINISFWTFGLAGLLALVIAFLTVAYQSIRAARANPVESLRYE